MTHFYNNNPKLKAVGVNNNFEQWQLEELAKCIEDPIYFIKTYVKIIHVDQGLIPFSTWEFQDDIIKLYHENRHVVLKLPRQCGKCFTKDNKLIVRSKKTDEILEMSVEDFYNLQK